MGRVVHRRATCWYLHICWYKLYCKFYLYMIYGKLNKGTVCISILLETRLAGGTWDYELSDEWPKKKYTSFWGFRENTGVCKTAISHQNFQRFQCQRKDIYNSLVFSPTAVLQISFVKQFLRLPVNIYLIINRIFYHI